MEGVAAEAATGEGTPRDRLRAHVELVEEAYEFFLAYAAQGMTGTEGRAPNSTLREYLDRLRPALEELGPLTAAMAAAEGIQPEDRFRAFRQVVEDDARKAGAAVGMVAARGVVSSQMIDNLNASVHLRALLTDLFLLDELVDLKVPAAPAGRHAGG